MKHSVLSPRVKKAIRIAFQIGIRFSLRWCKEERFRYKSFERDDYVIHAGQQYSHVTSADRPYLDQGSAPGL
jgi:hypothetical protein